MIGINEQYLHLLPSFFTYFLIIEIFNECTYVTIKAGIAIWIAEAVIATSSR